MKKALLKNGLALFAVIAVLTLLSNCSRQAANGSTVQLGAILPLTGDVASYGIAAKRGIDLAVDEINGRGGVAGRTIRVIYEDDQGQSSKTISAMQKLTSLDKVPLIMGSAASSTTLAICPMAERSMTLLISPISSSQELTGCSRYFFRVCPSDVVQAGMMADWIKENGHTRVGIVYVKNSWGQGLRDEFLKRFQAVGGQIVAEESVREGDRDLRAQITKMMSAKPEALYAMTYGREGGALLRQAKELAFRKPIYGADVWGAPELAETAQDAAKGARIIVPAKFRGERFDSFARAFQSRYGEQPDVYASYSYDMVHIVAPALASSNSPEALRAAIAATNYDGVTGVTKFDEHGDVVGKGFERRTLP